MKTITGYFRSIYKAQKTYSHIKNMGINSVKMDIIDRFSAEIGSGNERVISGDTGSLSYLVLKAGAGNIPIEQRSLYAADPNVSGMGSFKEVADSNIVLSVTIDDNIEEKIVNIIKQNEGEI